MLLNKFGINIFLVLLLFLYYFFFVNKGIVIYDEGYYAHIADRIVNGEVPYRDFFIQFTPGYFYILALFYKLFGTSIITGRILTVIICLGIGYLTLLIMDKFKSDLKFKILSLLSVASFGFPLINNMSLLAWPSVLLSLLAILFFIDKKFILLGVILSLLLFTKQNLGIYFFIFTNLFLFLLTPSFKFKARNIFFTNFAFFLTTFVWFSYFFVFQNGIDQFMELINFNRKYLSVYQFSYPPLSFILQPTGILKLLPYYLPIAFVFIAIKGFFNKKKNLNILYFSTLSLAGFFGTVYPTSDLLHVYPFFGMFLVSSLLFFRNSNLFKYWRLLVLILIGSGFYLTLFKEYYRYQPQYRYQKTRLDLPKTQNIFIDKPLATDLAVLNLFFTINTKKGDYILSYPFSPMLYFVLERRSPSRFANYYPGYLTPSQEKEVIKNLKEKKVRFIVTFLNYRFNTPISKFIQRQKKVYERGQFKIFEID